MRSNGPPKLTVIEGGYGKPRLAETETAPAARAPAPASTASAPPMQRARGAEKGQQHGAVASAKADKRPRIGRARMAYLDASGGLTRVSIQYAIGPEPPRGMMALVSGAAHWLGRAVHGEPHRRPPLTDPYAKT